ncbi:MAG: flagellar hook-basal body complex protein FliE [Thermodesulfobacteriota bacterium]|nr:flagellar hook-basal body complex protein FliE [Thermodesulfobacteriota bacterium]
MPEITVTNRIELPASPSVNDKGTGASPQGHFGHILEKAIGEVNTLQGEADKAVQELAAGAQKDIHGTMIALEKAEVSFKLMMQVRNKIISAYEEIMRMQV